MEHMQQAYEALIEKMKKQLDDSDEEKDKLVIGYSQAEEILMDFIFHRHGKATLMELARAIDEKHGRKDDYTQMVDSEYEA